MAQVRTKPALRRFWLYGLILLAFALVSGVLFILITDRNTITIAEAFPEPVILDPEKRPNFVFPEAARTTDLALNLFVDRFARVCMEGKYSDFRLMLSSQRPPVLPARFESNFNALKQVRIEALEKVPTLPGALDDVYIMSVGYDLQDFAVRRGERTKQVHVGLTKEDGLWHIGPIPREAVARFAAYKQAQSQPADPDTDVVTETAPPARANPATTPADSGPTSRTVANKPMRIDS
ncbi:MAG: hypothetical protein AABZ08_01380 [Planctomycetota bacterium]